MLDRASPPFWVLSAAAVIAKENSGLSKAMATGPTIPAAAAATHVFADPPKPLISRRATAVQAPEGSPVARHGQLTTSAGTMLDQHGRPVRLRGMSLFWECWMGKYWNSDVVEWLAKDWNISVLRLSMGVNHAGGYIDRPHQQKDMLRTVVDSAIENGIYAVIDWHETRANEHVEEATEFFLEMARDYGSTPNVLFETFNEPTLQNWSTEVKPYHETIIGAIRNHSDNIIILGTTTWSQDVDVASKDPAAGENLAYTLHFYAASHKEALREKARTALRNKITLFSTEWGTCDYTGNGTLNLEETRKWLEFMEEHNISSANWALSDKYEACSALMPSASISGGWTVRELTQSGFFMRNWLRDEDIGIPCWSAAWPCIAENPCAEHGAGCKEAKCCKAEGDFCFEKDAGWAQCMDSCTPGVHSTDPLEYRTPWSCAILGKRPEAIPIDWERVLAIVFFVWAVLATLFGVFAVQRSGTDQVERSIPRLCTSAVSPEATPRESAGLLAAGSRDTSPRDDVSSPPASQRPRGKPGKTQRQRDYALSAL